MEYIPAKTIISRPKMPAEWFGIDYNMNIYRGCCHGCIYCDSRSDCYHVENFDKVRAKEDALRIIRDELRRKVKTGVVGTGAMSDPYNPFEKELLLTRHSLELLNAFGFGAAIATKSNLITRDADVLKDIAAHSPVLIKITITTADDALCTKLEPNVAVSSQRFTALKALSGQGIYAGLLLMPVLPFVNDTEENILAIVRRAAEAGAKFIYAAFGVTLRSGQRGYYYEKLDKIFPGLSERYIKRYGERYSCASPKVKKLYEVFTAECERLGILYRMKDIINGYRMGYGSRQLMLPGLE